jgi:YVTN family beta-propeller protein
MMHTWLLLLTLQGGSADLVYVANQDAAKITVIDASTNTAIDTVDLQQLGFSPNAKPHHVVVEPDGSYWYVSLIGDNRVLKFNRNNDLIGQAAFDVAGMLAIHPTRDLLFVSRSMSAVNPPQRIGVIERASMSIDEIDVFFPRPHAIAVDRRGTHLYVGSLGQNRIVSVNLDTDEIEFADVGGGTPHSFVQFAVSPDSNTLVATTELTGKLLVFDIATAGRPVLSATVDVNPAPWDPIFTPDGRSVYFGNQRTNTITVVETSNWQIVTVIEGEGLAQPYGSIVSPDGRYVYVANRHIGGGDHSAHGVGQTDRVATVVVFDTQTNTIKRVIEVPGDATGIGARAAPPARSAGRRP